jgi:hypothetical protein
MVDYNSGPTPVALHDATRGAIEKHITSRIEAEFNNLQLSPRPAPPGVDDRRDADSGELAPDAKAGGDTTALTPTPLAMDKHHRTGTTIPSEPPIARRRPAALSGVGSPKSGTNTSVVTTSSRLSISRSV